MGGGDDDGRIVYDYYQNPNGGGACQCPSPGYGDCCCVKKPSLRKWNRKRAEVYVSPTPKYTGPVDAQLLGNSRAQDRAQYIKYQNKNGVKGLPAELYNLPKRYIRSGNKWVPAIVTPPAELLNTCNPLN